MCIFYTKIRTFALKMALAYITVDFTLGELKTDPAGMKTDPGALKTDPGGLRTDSHGFKTNRPWVGSIGHGEDRSVMRRTNRSSLLSPHFPWFLCLGLMCIIFYAFGV